MNTKIIEFDKDYNWISGAICLLNKHEEYKILKVYKPAKWKDILSKLGFNIITKHAIKVQPI